MNELLDYQKKIESWGEKVGLYDKIHGASLLTQKIKFFEEFGELCSGELKRNKELIEDSIGDCFVVLVHLQKFKNDGAPFKIVGIQELLTESTFREKIDLLSSEVSLGRFNLAATILLNLSLEKTGSEFKCIDIAYNEIKDRKGKMVNGTFIKESDL